MPCQTCKKDERCTMAPRPAVICLDYSPLGPITPCPFCGSRQIHLHSMSIDVDLHYFYKCQVCGCKGPHSADFEEALPLWNYRFPDMDNSGAV